MRLLKTIHDISISVSRATADLPCDLQNQTLRESYPSEMFPWRNNSNFTFFSNYYPIVI